MKTLLKFYFTISLIAISMSGSQAQTPTDVLAHGSSVTFFGVDFSKCKGVMLGATAEEMRDKYFPAINNLLIVEVDKYNVKKALFKSEVISDPREVNRLNMTIDIQKFSVYSISEIPPLDSNTIAKVVHSYNLKDNKGIGLVFVAESLDKTKEIGTYYLVYFSMPEGKVILSEKVHGSPGGFGVRNFWARTISNILQPELQKNLEKKYLPKKNK
jgi:hypothetical protein